MKHLVKFDLTELDSGLSSAIIETFLERGLEIILVPSEYKYTIIAIITEEPEKLKADYQHMLDNPEETMAI